MCSETSPRISFSHDLRQPEEVVAIDHKESRRDTMLLDSSPDFEFSIGSCFDQESTSADELFANGVILPVKIQDKVVASRQVQKCPPPPVISLPPLPRPSTYEKSKKEISVKEILVVNYDPEDQKPQAKSFWGFKRSSSLNHEAKKSLICSLPLLSRSHSTGSVSNKRPLLKDVHKGKSKSSSSSSSSASSAHQLQQKPPLKKSYVGSYGNGVKISPVLNVPPPYISKGTANLFGLGSLLRSGSKDKKNKK